jgi:hypothetical protein
MYENGEKTGSFAHVLVNNSLKTLFFAQKFPCLLRLLPSIISVHYVDLVLLSKYVLEEVMQLLDVPLFFQFDAVQATGFCLAPHGLSLS